MPAKPSKTRVETEARYKAAIADLQCQLSKGEWTPIKSVEFSSIHSICSSFLNLLANRGIIERRHEPGVLKGCWQYRRTGNLAQLTAQNFRRMNCTYQAQFINQSGTDSTQQLTIPTTGVSSTATTAGQADIFDLRGIENGEILLSPAVLKIGIIGRNGTQVLDCPVQDLEGALAYADSLMDLTVEKAFVFHVMAVVERQTIVTRY